MGVSFKVSKIGKRYASKPIADQAECSPRESSKKISHAFNGPGLVNVRVRTLLYGLEGEFVVFQPLKRQKEIRCWRCAAQEFSQKAARIQLDITPNFRLTSARILARRTESVSQIPRFQSSDRLGG
ncbi:hypothetical protein KSP40_PGU008967 [Platanthera guangdongensis]|uniref:Uncharacterized protein n=1 Tax=Platanthera guangdongensis TaxID=2320717 RepID=A0ABR2MUU7_9ASPA